MKCILLFLNELLNYVEKRGWCDVNIFVINSLFNNHNNSMKKNNINDINNINNFESLDESLDVYIDDDDDDLMFKMEL